jgi:hypothetical protein
MISNEDFKIPSWIKCSKIYDDYGGKTFTRCEVSYEGHMECEAEKQSA